MGMVLRKHQVEVRQIANDIATGARDNKVTAVYVTPGGGKTLLASIFAHTLVQADDVDHVLVVVPRDSLRDQMIKGWRCEAAGLFGGLAKGHGANVLKGQKKLFANERMGVVTTFADIAIHRAAWTKLLGKHNWLVILDESHHLPDVAIGDAEDPEEGGWTRAVAPLVTLAKRVLCMSGTPVREAKPQKLAFIDHDEDRRPVFDVRYTRRDALDERAILNVSVDICDGDATYWHKMKRHEHTLSTVPTSEQSRALRTVLNDPDYRDRVLFEAIDGWEKHRDTVNARSRMIVICDTQPMAKEVARVIQKRTAANGRPWAVALAITENPDAKSELARFRDSRAGDVLVTVQMAYEGLDVPDCTHLVALTKIRSRPWLEQAFSRVTRFDYAAGIPWENQCAYLYVPNDPDMVAFLSSWLDEQDTAVPENATGASKVVPRGKSSFRAESGELTEHNYADTHGVYTEADTRRLRALERQHADTRLMPAAARLSIARLVYRNDNEIPDLESAG
jgi:superfamily II DNA or RNA helicase